MASYFRLVFRGVRLIARVLLPPRAGDNIICTGFSGQGCRTLLVYPPVRIHISVVATFITLLLCRAPAARAYVSTDPRLFSSQGATNVQCALCNVVTPVPPSGNDMAQIDCGGCRTRLMYVRGATSVQCSVCNTVNLAIQGASRKG